MTSTLIPALLYFFSTFALFGIICYTWGYLKGRGYEYIEILSRKEDK